MSNAPSAAERLHRLQGIREGTLERLRDEAAAAELAECTFSPQMANNRTGMRCVDGWPASRVGRRERFIVPEKWKGSGHSQGT